jgi:uncharacterized protein
MPDPAAPATPRAASGPFIGPASGHGAEPVTLGPADLVAVIRAFRDGLRSNQAALNRLNVYPVPDGDTGTNMALTVESVVAQLPESSAAAELAMAEACRLISHWSLMGARGNSGTILSQILRGLCTAVRGTEAIGPAELTAGLRAASTAAYSAVLKPIEGTILTVARVAAETAEQALASGVNSVIGIAEAARHGAQVGIDQTPELLPVLRQAGVVDAGGVGYSVLLDAVLYVIDGRAMPLLDPTVTADVDAIDASAVAATSSAAVGNVADLRYEVMYLLEADDKLMDGFKDAWAAIGDSIAIVGGEGLYNCHIHTDNIGAAIEAAIDIGRPRSIRVTDLLDEAHAIAEERWVREATGDARVEEPPHVHTPVETAIVVVANGDGIKRLFWSLGVQQVVTGGQSMNPSTAQLVEAVEACPADNVVILPNNKNIIAVAEQVDALTSKSVRVVRTVGVTEGLAAAMQYDPAGDLDTNTDEMTNASASIVSGEVTVAVRDSASDAGEIRVGDAIGIARGGGIVAIDETIAGVSIKLLDRIVTPGHEIVTIIEGEGSSAALTREITEWLADHRPAVTPEIHHGGQPLYPYVFGAE